MEAIARRPIGNCDVPAPCAAVADEVGHARESLAEAAGIDVGKGVIDPAGGGGIPRLIRLRSRQAGGRRGLRPGRAGIGPRGGRRLREGSVREEQCERDGCSQRQCNAPNSPTVHILSPGQAHEMFEPPVNDGRIGQRAAAFDRFADAPQGLTAAR